MPLDFEFARKYLAAPQDGFWEWQDRGEVVTWAGGPTIAFRGELEGVLRAMVPHGLPPLTAIVLLLAACKDTWPNEHGALVSPFRFLAACNVPTSPLEAVVAGLNRVHHLPPELIGTLAGKGVLAASVFEGTRPHIQPADAEAILQVLRSAPPQEVFAPQAPLTTQELVHQLNTLRAGLARVDAEALLRRLRTGLEQELRPADERLPLGEAVRKLLTQLDNDPELGGLARLARNLMAVIHLPRPISDREDLPLGGVSDITNRGPLDRLLLSELAHDTATLCIRVALNEALYLRREMPPRTPPRSRAVLLDSGLRCWGVPRVYATAVALSLAATSGQDVAVRICRAARRNVIPCDLGTRSGLDVHLAALEPDVHPGQALPAFAEFAQQGENPADAVIVTEDDVLDDAQFLQALGELKWPGCFIVAINRQGRFRLLHRTRRGTRLMRQAQLELQRLLAPTQRPVLPLIDARHDKLPAILTVRPFPLLLSHKIDLGRAWRVDALSALAITGDRRLMYWERRGLGGRQLADDLPAGPLLWAQRTSEQGIVKAVVGQPRAKLHLLTIDLYEKSCRHSHLEHGGDLLRTVFEHQGFLIAVYRGRGEVFELTQGRRVHGFDLPSGLTWRQGRFFYSSYLGWCALSFDGSQAVFRQVVPADPIGTRLITMFECAGVEGPIGVTSTGRLYYTAEKTMVPARERDAVCVRLDGISRDGTRLLVSTAPRLAPIEWTTHLIHVRSGESHPVSSLNILARLEPELAEIMHPWPWRRKFTHIYVRDGKLTLVSRSGNHWQIDSRQPRNQWCLHQGMRQAVPAGALRFERTASPPGTGYRLWVASWSDGSRAFLDSRGLLHLQSAHREIPEASLVLTDMLLPGWSSDGRLWGPRYFVAEGTVPVNEEAILGEILRRFLEPLP